jgi:hypothetical protein
LSEKAFLLNQNELLLRQKAFLLNQNELILIQQERLLSQNPSEREAIGFISLYFPPRRF